ncbi:MAG: 2-dehydro-3-deoxygalactonokinase [Verrucomicrobiae bacterium]|nr:2-dehydro-3-deoxygalactonokinase [Verrucomicrobiae bacterium]
MKENANLNSAAKRIVVDWGSTNFRAKLVVDGEVVDQVQSADGIRLRGNRDFDEILNLHCGHWAEAHSDIPVIMSGMIGSREGWREIPYVAAPASVADLAAGLVAVPSQYFDSVVIVPGVRSDDAANGTTDVMRGEETQVIGLLESIPTGPPVTICLPGTHSKWIVCRDGRIDRFRTWLTGEAFDRLTHESLIAGTGGEVELDSPAFSRGLALADTEGGLLHHLFLGRTEMLTGRIKPTELRSLISGLLIGHELREARAFAEGTVFLVGDSPAAAATAKGMAFIGLTANRIVADTHLAGVLAIEAARK